MAKNSFFEQGFEQGKAWREAHQGVEGGGIQMDAAATACKKLGLTHDDDMEFYSGWYAGIDEVDARREKR